LINPWSQSRRTSSTGCYVGALDLNHDQIIDDQDLAIFEELKGFPPGPSALRP